MFERLEHKQVYEEVIDIILERIRSGKLAVGDKLPPERVLAEEMLVSRTSLRDALRELKNMGYIRSVKGGGNYVTPVNLDRFLSPLHEMVVYDTKLLQDVIEVRQHLEAYMAALAAKGATDEQIERIGDALAKMRAEVEAGGSGLQGDNLFHLEIARASQNRAFVIIMESLHELLTESRKATLAIPGQPAKTIHDHTLIFEAIKNHDVQKAEAEMREHLKKAVYNLDETSLV